MSDRIKKAREYVKQSFVDDSKGMPALLLGDVEEVIKILSETNSDDRIEKGDIVDVSFNTADSIFDAEVLYIPCSSGDCFVLKDKKGIIYNVQSFNFMRKVRESE